MKINNREKVLDHLRHLDIGYKMVEHPPTPTIEEALKYWSEMDSTHCKNLFFRNHKGNQHYLVIFRFDKQLAVKDLELRLKQGKLSFASPERMARFLGVTPGSVSLFGLINDAEKYVIVFLDQNLRQSEYLSFHPNDNTASLMISQDGFMKFLNHSGHRFEFIELY
jgi:Ala-tRNA(Pro) deacylase